MHDINIVPECQRECASVLAPYVQAGPCEDTLVGGSGMKGDLQTHSLFSMENIGQETPFY